MGQPITWRNVDAPDLRGSAALMGIAQQGINKGFDQFQNVLQRQQQVDEANWNQVKENNTNELRNQLFAARTPEEAQAVQAQIMERMNTLGAQVNQESIRTAMDGRIPLLQQRAKAKIDYNNAMTDAKDEPILKARQAELLSDPIMAVANAMDPNSGLSDRGRLAFMEQVRKITNENVTYDQNRIKFGREGEKFELDKKKAEDDLKTNEAQRAASQASTNLTNIRARIAEEELTNGETRAEGKARKEQEAKAKQKVIDDLYKSSIGGKGWLGEPEGNEAVSKWLQSDPRFKGDASAYDYASRAIGKLATEGIEITRTGPDGKAYKEKLPIPASEIISHLNAADKFSWLPNKLSNRGDNAIDAFKARVEKDPDLAIRIADSLAIKGNLSKEEAAALKKDIQATYQQKKADAPESKLRKGLGIDTPSAATAAVTPGYVPTTADIMRQRLQRGSLRQP